MDLTKLREPLKAHEIDFRIQSINKAGYATILSYKDARVDMNRLDEVCGPQNWQRDHKEIKNVIYGGIGIRTEIRIKPGEVNDGGWVWKWDAGTESFTEKQKGEASDSYKRAGFNWGIGRELYDYPVIKIQLQKSADESKPKNGEWFIDPANGNPKQGWGLQLKAWTWYSQFNKENELTYLGARDNKGKIRFQFGTYVAPTTKKATK